MAIQAKLTGNVDNWHRPIAKNIKTEDRYVDVNLGMGKADWHTVTPGWDEPCTPIKLEIVERDDYSQEQDPHYYI